MKDTIKLSLTLFIITAISALILSLSNNITAPVIAQSDEVKKEQAKLELLSDADEFKPVDEEVLKAVKDEDNNITECEEALKNNEIIGYIFKATTSGYGGDIEFMIGISEGKLKGIQIIKHTETPGLGASMMKPSFMNSFKEKSIDNELTAVSAPVNDSEVQSITSATVTTTAVVGEVNNLIKIYNEVLNK